MDQIAHWCVSMGTTQPGQRNDHSVLTQCSRLWLNRSPAVYVVLLYQSRPWLERRFRNTLLHKSIPQSACPGQSEPTECSRRSRDTSKQRTGRTGHPSWIKHAMPEFRTHLRRMSSSWEETWSSSASVATKDEVLRAGLWLDSRRSLVSCSTLGLRARSNAVCPVPKT